MSLKRYTLSVEDYRRSRDDYAEQWRTLDDYLYRLCRENPLHSCRLGVNAKVYIIGRTYQTGIERKIRTKGTQGSSMSQIADFFYKRHQELDCLFLRLAKISEPLTGSNIPEILGIHGQIVNLLSEVTIDGQSPRSFVSKYMHFHNPVVPLYDSIVAEVLPRLAPPRSMPDSRVSIPKDADPWYSGYVHQFLVLFDLIASQNPEATVRSVDYCLLCKREWGEA